MVIINSATARSKYKTVKQLFAPKTTTVVFHVARTAIVVLMGLTPDAYTAQFAGAYLVHPNPATVAIALHLPNETWRKSSRM